MASSVYCVICIPNNRKYIGITNKEEPLSRALEHLTDAYSTKRNSKYFSSALFPDIKYYGIYNFTITALATNIPNKLATAIEAFYIMYFKTFIPFGYNIKSSVRLANIGSEYVNDYALINNRSYYIADVEPKCQFANLCYKKSIPINNIGIDNLNISVNGTSNNKPHQIYHLIPETQSAYNHRREYVLQTYGIDIAEKGIA